VCPRIDPYSGDVRVVAGTFRGRRLVAPRVERGPDVTRPTTDKVRESVFNALVSRGLVHDAAVIDLFAGSGALGIEALSRGARHCTFVERDPRAVAAVRANVDHLGVKDRSRVVVADVMTALRSLTAVDLVLADPPYHFDAWDELLAHTPAPLVIAESDRPLIAPPGWTVSHQRRYGRAWVTWFQKVP
jgi:16S rRNA (guanine966-N2)-methyltransferase